MPRRIRVKCPECAATLEMRVVQQDLLDVKCPRCQHAFTAKVPAATVPSVVQATEVEAPVAAEIDILTPEPARPKRQRLPSAASSRPVKQRPAPAPSSFDSPWVPPAPGYGSQATEPGGAINLKAVLIAAGSVVGLGLLVFLGFMAKSAIGKVDFSSVLALNQSSAASTKNTPASLSDSAAISSNVYKPGAFAYSSHAPALESSITGSSPISPVPTSESLAASSNARQDFNNDSSVANFGNSSVSDFVGMVDVVVLLAEQLGEATLTKDAELLVDRTYPGLVKYAGGRSKMVAITDRTFRQLSSSGTVIHSYVVERNITFKRVGNKVFAVVPTVSEMTISNSRVRQKGYLLGISEDDGKSFSYLDGGGLKDTRLRSAIVPRVAARFSTAIQPRTRAYLIGPESPFAPRKSVLNASVRAQPYGFEAVDQAGRLTF